MSPSLQRFCCVATAALTLLISARPAVAAEHIVPLRELQQRLENTAQQRVKNSADIQRVLSYPAAAAELAKYNIDAQQVKLAVATLNDDELTRLAARARASEKDVQGGLIVGLLALIGLIVVILVVVSVVSDASISSPAHGGVENVAAVPQIAAVHG